jgi:hypothetical protein
MIPAEAPARIGGTASTASRYSWLSRFASGDRFFRSPSRDDRAQALIDAKRKLIAWNAAHSRDAPEALIQAVSP